jgi:hypothetical protein
MCGTLVTLSNFSEQAIAEASDIGLELVGLAPMR